MNRPRDIQSRLKKLEEAERRLKSGLPRTNVVPPRAIETERQQLRSELRELKIDVPEPAPRKGIRDR